jgi:hypothetical protein
VIFRPPVLLSQATVVWATGDRRIVITRQGVFSLWAARDGHAPAFSGACKVVPGNMKSNLLQGDSGDGACSTHVVFPAKIAPLLWA